MPATEQLINDCFAFTSTRPFVFDDTRVHEHAVSLIAKLFQVEQILQILPPFIKNEPCAYCLSVLSYASLQITISIYCMTL